ncbi:DNA primase [Saccharicrinis fermentans]|uniref:DNA primase n=1 Tax=Saccharicrinis fermentans DSM 9555 = JCM 21142 TaxID=869213 RepID=W7Y479_9BACT|nr:DNA primase [Saccharicrinis fermentans]GAF02882.1 DNA primase [Saccharicrinis fermentans DSM 9555 = JCM 21142]
MIDQNTVDRIVETSQANIVDVVSEFVTLRKRGINYLGNCPFHNEKTPSFTVSPHKGIYKCFGCGKGGNAVNFVMDVEQISFIDAIKQLGKKFHIHIEEVELSPEQQQVKNDRESMMAVSGFAQKFFTNQLLKSDEGRSVGLSYLRSRGFRDDIIQKFELGYSPEAKTALTDEALKNSYKLEFLEKAGLTIVRDNYKADRFRGRVIFPIHSISGKPTAFGGRVLKTDKKTAKYLNSPESEIYHKSRILYGIFHAKTEITKKDRCFLVEGYTDVISFHQAGITNVVASSGTALTVDQIRLIARFTPNITIIYDGDPAGIKASLRGIDLVLEQGMNVKVLLLPEGEDPDSFSKSRSAEELQAYITKHEGDFIKFKTGLLLKDAENDPVKRAGLLQDIVKTISVIPDAIVRGEYVKECSALMNVTEQVLYNEIAKLTKKSREEKYRGNTPSIQVPQVPSSPTASPAFTTLNLFEEEEKELIRFMIKYGDIQMVEVEEGKEEEEEEITVGDYILEQLREDELECENPLYNKILKLYEENKKKKGFQAVKFFVSHMEQDVSRLATDLLSKEYPLSKIHQRFGAGDLDEASILDRLVPKVVNELKLKKVKALIDKYRNELKLAEQKEDGEKMIEIMQTMVRLQQLQSLLSKELGDRTIV